MKVSKFYIINLKKNIFTVLLCIFIICLLIFSKNNITAAKSGLQLWSNSIVPSLFPFFVAIELLNNTNVPNNLGKLFNKIMKPLFNVPGIGAYPFIMGLISGYPTGAKIITNFRKNNLITKAEAERLLTFTNNSGSLFIIGTVGVTLFSNTTIGVLLLITHILACISVGIVFRFWKYNDKELLHKNLTTYTKETKSSNILSTSITNAINTTLMIGGFVVLFSIIISILNSSKIMIFLSTLLSPIIDIFGINNNFSMPIISGIIELTNGVSMVSSISNKLISTNIIITAFLLGFGGISVVLQIYAIIADYDISIIPYILGKFFQGIFASIYTFLFIKIFPFFNFDIVPVFYNNVDPIKYNNYSYIIIGFLFILFLVIKKLMNNNIKYNI